MKNPRLNSTLDDCSTKPNPHHIRKPPKISGLGVELGNYIAYTNSFEELR